jgi:predicted PurR-regulated permease PerM
MRKLAAATALVLGTTLVAAVAYARRGDLLLLALSLALTAAVHPLVDRLVQRGAPRALAVGVVYVCGLIAILTLVAVLGGPVLAELRTGIDEFFAGYESARAHMPEGSDLQRVLARALPPASELYRGLGSGDPAGWALSALGVTANAVQAVTQTLVVIVLSVYWAAADRPERRVGTRLLCAIGCGQARMTWMRMLANVGAHVRVEIARVVSYLALLSLGYRLLELKYWVLPAALAALLGLIPLLGAVLAMLIAAAAASANGTLVSLLAVAYTALVVRFVETAIRRALSVQHTQPILLTLTLLALVGSAGPVSALLAPPLAAAIESLAGALIDQNGNGAQAAIVAQIDLRLERLREHAAHAPPETSAAASALIEYGARVAARIRKFAS